MLGTYFKMKGLITIFVFDHEYIKYYINTIFSMISIYLIDVNHFDLYFQVHFGGTIESILTSNLHSDQVQRNL